MRTARSLLLTSVLTALLVAAAPSSMDDRSPPGQESPTVELVASSFQPAFIVSNGVVEAPDSNPTREITFDVAVAHPGENGAQPSQADAGPLSRLRSSDPIVHRLLLTRSDRSAVDRGGT